MLALESCGQDARVIRSADLFIEKEAQKLLYPCVRVCDQETYFNCKNNLCLVALLKLSDYVQKQVNKSSSTLTQSGETCEAASFTSFSSIKLTSL